MEYLVDFHNDGRRLFGIVHAPDSGGSNGLGINLLCPGIKHRVGPHRLNVKIARELCKAGFYVLRFDPHGVGDSEGTLPCGPISDLWRSVQLGRFVSDTIAATDFFTKEVDLNSVCLAGLCGGAITGILSAKEDKRVSHLILIDLPVIVLGKPLEFSDMLAPGEFSDNVFRLYLRKLIDLQSLWRLVTFQSDLKAIFKLLKIQGRKLSGRVRSKKKRQSLPYNFNFKLLDAFEECVLRDVKMLFILAGNDYSTAEFEQMFEGSVLKKISRANSLCNIHKILKANHSYTLTEWQDELFQKAKSFLALK